MKHKSLTMKFVLMVVAVSLLILPGIARAQALEYGGDGPEVHIPPAVAILGVDAVDNGDFELGNFSSWGIYRAGATSGPFVYSGTTTPQSGHPIPAPPQGTYAATTDQSGGNVQILYQDIVLNNMYELNFMLYSRNWAGAYYSPASLNYTLYPNQQFRVDIMNPAAPLLSVAPADIYLNIFQTMPGDPLVFPWAPYSADLSPWIGQTVRLRFAEVDNLLWFNGAVDDVSLELVLALEKTKVSGPDEIGICLPDPTTYVFEILYSGPPAMVMDTVPAEFKVTGTSASAGAVDVFSANKKDNDKSATIISWLAPEGTSTLTVTIETRESPGKGHGKKGMVVYKPTSCGTLNLNDGAMAYQVDEDGNPILDPDTGEMIPIEGLEDGSEPLEVEAVCGAKPCAPENLTVTLVGDDTLSLDWDDVCVGGDPVVYNVYRDGVLIAEDLEDSEYDDSGLAPGHYCYEVEAEYVGGGPGYESGKSNEACGDVPTP